MLPASHSIAVPKAATLLHPPCNMEAGNTLLQHGSWKEWCWLQTAISSSIWFLLAQKILPDEASWPAENRQWHQKPMGWEGRDPFPFEWVFLQHFLSCLFCSIFLKYLCSTISQKQKDDTGTQLTCWRVRSSTLPGEYETAGRLPVNMAIRTSKQDKLKMYLLSPVENRDFSVIMLPEGIYSIHSRTIGVEHPL